MRHHLHIWIDRALRGAAVSAAATAFRERIAQLKHALKYLGKLNSGMDGSRESDIMTK